MAQERNDPLADLFTLFAAPLSGTVRSLEQFRKGVDEFLKGVENFNRTMANLNETTERINALLADVEEPIRAAIPQVTRTVKAADEMMQVVSGPAMAVAPGLEPSRRDTQHAGVRSAPPSDRPVRRRTRRGVQTARTAHPAGRIRRRDLRGIPRPRHPGVASRRAARSRAVPSFDRGHGAHTADAGASPAREPAARKKPAAKRSPAKKSPAKKPPAKNRRQAHHRQAARLGHPLTQSLAMSERTACGSLAHRTRRFRCDERTDRMPVPSLIARGGAGGGASARDEGRGGDGAGELLAADVDR